MMTCISMFICLIIDFWQRVNSCIKLQAAPRSLSRDHRPALPCIPVLGFSSGSRAVGGGGGGAWAREVALLLIDLVTDNNLTNPFFPP